MMRTVRTGCLLAFVGFALGCGSWLDPHGPASICALYYPTLAPAAQDAVDFWHAAGLTGLRPCADGSIQIEVLAVEPSDGNVGTESPTFDNPHIQVAPSVLARAASDERYAADVLAHELGHALGLQHVSDDNSVMWHQVHDLPASPDDVDHETATTLLGR